MMVRSLTCLLLLNCLFVSVPVQAAPRIALVIGNSAYPDAPLKNPVNDAADITSALEALGFKVALHRDADHRQMEEAVKAFGRQARDSEVALFYYAGHGIQNGGRNYLVPVGASVDREADLRWNTLDVGKVLDEMGYARSGLNIVILDACRNNPLTRSFRSADRGLVRMRDVPQGTLVAYATSPGQVAADGDGRNSPFTAALLKSIQAPGMPLEMTMKSVMAEVKTITGGRQIPWVSSSVTSDFQFVPGSPKVLTNTGPDATETTFWQSTEACGTPLCYRAYLDAYPQGRFRALASARVGEAEISNATDGASPATYALSVATDPPQAQVRILNIKVPYHAGLRLRPGRYLVEVSQPGYETVEQWLDLGHADRNFQVSLAPSVVFDAVTDPLTGMEFVPIAGGCFQMGSASDAPDRASDERQHEVCVRDFLIGKFEVTFEQYDRFVAETGRSRPDDESWGRGRRPVINVSWIDAAQFAKWLSRQTGRRYRLPTEAEWEYAARAGGATNYDWGDAPGENQANCRGCGSRWDDKSTAPVGSFAPNGWGLYDMSGNVMEWTCSVYDADYAGGETRCDWDTSGSMSLRGGGWGWSPKYLRSAARGRLSALAPGVDSLGFRLVRVDR